MFSVPPRTGEARLVSLSPVRQGGVQKSAIADLAHRIKALSRMRRGLLRRACAHLLRETLRPGPPALVARRHMSASAETVDVAIVGSGMVGAAFAARLSTQGLSNQLNILLVSPAGLRPPALTGPRPKCPPTHLRPTTPDRRLTAAQSQKGSRTPPRRGRRGSA